MDEQMRPLTMNIKREFFAAIVAGTKRIEYRNMSRYWKPRIEWRIPPFKLRLLNGMKGTIPEAVVVVKRVTRLNGEYRLHLGDVLRVRRWDRKKQQPKA